MGPSQPTSLLPVVPPHCEYAAPSVRLWLADVKAVRLAVFEAFAAAPNTSGLTLAGRPLSKAFIIDARSSSASPLQCVSAASSNRIARLSLILRLLAAENR
eukprot:5172040-Prymnesium_polylepis.2